MKAKKEQSPEAGPTPITVEYADSKGQTQRKGFEGPNQAFYDGVQEISKDMAGKGKGKK